MGALDLVRDAIPDPARDLKLNLQSVMAETSLTPAQRWGVAVTAAVTSRNARLRAAVLDDARDAVAGAVVDDALAAAALMGMNNVYYRFRHLIDKPEYKEKPARLRMNRLAKPAANKVDFELFALAASAINGCGACMQAHEKVVLAGGLTEDQVHDAIRLASIVNGAAIALDLVTDVRTEPVG
ncbi:MAG TPA: carboxymuconolactone decarboxylase family protein [Polyangia bacterium]|jgi:alkyl hydroperoxide reductase subunit D|nr:carboxymuconolactone decarboxylase family protein [Polyangia bacterium]